MTYQDLYEALERMSPERRRQYVKVKHYAQAESHFVSGLTTLDCIGGSEARGQVVLEFVP